LVPTPTTPFPYTTLFRSTSGRGDTAGSPNPVRCKAKQVPLTRPAEGPGTPQREMVTLDRTRLTGLLRKKPWKRGFFYGPSLFAADRKSTRLNSSHRTISY